MKALSVRQPWAYLITAGIKDVENRSRRTYHRGLVAIHASLTVSQYARVPSVEGAAALDQVGGIQATWDARAGNTGHPLLARGAIIGVAEITDSHDFECPSQDFRCSPWAMPRSWHWLLTNARALAEPVTCTGRLGLWDLPADVEAALLAQGEAMLP